MEVESGLRWPRYAICTARLMSNKPNFFLAARSRFKYEGVEGALATLHGTCFLPFKVENASIDLVLWQRSTLLVAQSLIKSSQMPDFLRNRKGRKAFELPQILPFVVN